MSAARRRHASSNGILVGTHLNITANFAQRSRPAAATRSANETTGDKNNVILIFSAVLPKRQNQKVRGVPPFVPPHMAVASMSAAMEGARNGLLDNPCLCRSPFGAVAGVFARAPPPYAGPGRPQGRRRAAPDRSSRLGDRAMNLLAVALALVAVLGLVQCLAGWAMVTRFAAMPTPAPRRRPPVTILKPLCGDEPFLADALVSCCCQDYPIFQIVFGVRDAADPALAVVRELKKNFPECDITIVVDSTVHGRNRKVANLINMLPAARYDLLVFSDSDLHLAPDYLERLVAALEKPDAGLVSTLYVGRPARQRWPLRLAAAQINYSFLPGALLARALGRQDCLGSTMALHRRTLERIGGLRALVEHVADDNVLGQRVAALGLSVHIADTVPAATVPESTLTALWQHEMRWARTIRALVPLSFGVSALQYPFCWALLACILSGEALPYVALLGFAWAVRAAAAWGIDHALKPKLAPLGLAPAVPVWLLPFRDILSIVEIIVSYYSNSVVWRGTTMEADNGIAPALALRRHFGGANMGSNSDFSGVPRPTFDGLD
jgi:ceramide glucosyltransferase